MVEEALQKVRLVLLTSPWAYLKFCVKKKKSYSKRKSRQTSVRKTHPTSLCFSLDECIISFSWSRTKNVLKSHNSVAKRLIIVINDCGGDTLFHWEDLAYKINSQTIVCHLKRVIIGLEPKFFQQKEEEVCKGVRLVVPLCINESIIQCSLSSGMNINRLWRRDMGFFFWSICICLLTLRLITG